MPLIALTNGTPASARPRCNSSASPNKALGRPATVLQPHGRRNVLNRFLEASTCSTSPPTASARPASRRRYEATAPFGGFSSDTAFSLFLLRDAADSYLFGDVQGEDNRFTSVSTFVTNSWAHVALVFDGSAAPSARSKLYVNGQLDKTSGDASAQIEAYTSDVVIGHLVGGGNRFIGLIDEVAIWTRALSADEIHDIFVAPGPL
jgi:hypothetical protein